VLFALFFSALLAAFAYPSARAEEAGPPAGTGAAIVDGLAPGDLLNIRATPSPIGRVEARLPNGAGVTNLGCTQYSGYDWCKVSTLDAPKVTGWTPARYLRAADGGADAPEAAAPPAQAASGRPPADVPDYLDARLGKDGASAAGAADDEQLRDALIARYRPVYRAALGLPGNGDAGVGGSGPAAPDAAESDVSAGGPDLPDGADIPHPTPRPDRQAATSAPALASVEAAQKTIGEIPCAGAFGRPMSMCRAAVTRLGPGVADVAVALPDGGSRTIRFRGGKPDGSDSSEPLRFTREGTLNLIRIGNAERFEILDALALGK
jgi:hypothetical protein